MPGSFTVKPIAANLTRDTVFIGKMSPYCEISLGDKIVTSNISKKGGKNPHWEDVVTLPAPTGKDTMLHLAVLDKETLIHDDHIGTLDLDLKEVEKSGPVSKWYPLLFNERPAGEILLDLAYAGENAIPKPLPFNNCGAVTHNAAKGWESQHKVYSEQKQTVEPHTFNKDIDVVEIVPVTQKVEVMESNTFMQDIEYTELVKVIKKVETIEPQVVTKQIEVIEPRVVEKTIKVVENVIVMKDVKVFEPKSVVRDVETYEPKTFHKQVEVTEYVPVTKEVQVTEPIHVKKDVEYVQPKITIQTITKEIREPVMVKEEVKTTVGPATVIEIGRTTVEDKLTPEMIKAERLYEEKNIKEKLSEEATNKHEELVGATWDYEKTPAEVTVATQVTTEKSGKELSNESKKKEESLEKTIKKILAK